jgi:hypothetical protein
MPSECNFTGSHAHPNRAVIVLVHHISNVPQFNPSWLCRMTPATGNRTIPNSVHPAAAFHAHETDGGQTAANIVMFFFVRR